MFARFQRANEGPREFEVESMLVLPGSIQGLFSITSPKLEDRRGFFREHYRHSALAAAIGREPKMRQGNHSRSRAGVLRGFHAEAWDKLIYVVRGTATCVVADTRPDSPTFGRHESFLIGDAPGEHMRIFVAEGLSNAFYCHTEVDYLNDVSAEFRPEGRGGVLWSDETLAVDWPTRSPILSDVDANLPTLRALYPDHPRFAPQ
jgi:dTDP-4-dehydrorhamnose 3,5-epimerase